MATVQKIIIYIALFMCQLICQVLCCDSEMEICKSYLNNSLLNDVEFTNRALSEKRRIMKNSIKNAAAVGLQQMLEMYNNDIIDVTNKDNHLDINHPGSKLSLFSMPINDELDEQIKAGYASLFTAKILNKRYNWDFTVSLQRKNTRKKLSLRQTTLESFCPPRKSPNCLPATKRYRTHDGTCNNAKRPRWGSAMLPFHRFILPAYSDGLDSVRGSVNGGLLPSTRLVSLMVHGYREMEEDSITMLLPSWGQLIDHDITSTVQPKAVNGTVIKCCRPKDIRPHSSCMPIKVPRDDPWLQPLAIHCLEFLRSAPAQRPDCFLSWREQINQATSYIDGSAIYSTSLRQSDNARLNRGGQLLFGRSTSNDDCFRGSFERQCIRVGDNRGSEQPGLLAMHVVFVREHNRIARDLSVLNSHWSDEKLYQETRKIIGAILQHITYTEFLPIVLGKEVCRIFEIDINPHNVWNKYNPNVNPTIANSFSTAAFRFGHSLIQSTIMRCNSKYQFLNNNVSLHEEFDFGDINESGSLSRIIRGMARQRTLKRDEFMSPELTNHLFQSRGFPFGMDLAAINIQRGRDHGLPSYTQWREPCGLSEILSWKDLELIVGPNSANRIRRAYKHVDDIDLFVGGISERPVVGGLVGPTFACIIAQQFSNIRKGDRFWYENENFESSFTRHQIKAIKEMTLSKVLCNVLGANNFIQLNAFKVFDPLTNDRLQCGSKKLAPLDLSPWYEDLSLKGNLDITTTSTLKPLKNSSINASILDNVAISIEPIIINREDKNKTKQKVNNKLDLKPPMEPQDLPLEHKSDVEQATTLAIE